MTKRKHPRVGTDRRTRRPIVKYRDPSGRQRTKGGSRPRRTPRRGTR